MVRQIVSSSDDKELKESYNQRLKDQKKWEKESRVTNVKVGDKLDVLDTEYIWCKGKVIKVLQACRCNGGCGWFSNR